MSIKNKIPVYREILADMETPLSVYLKLANGPFSYLFESVEGGDKWARYSLIGLPAKKILTLSQNLIEIIEDGVVKESFESDDPLGFIEEYQKNVSVNSIESLPKFNGGLVGYFGYDCI